MSFFILTGLFIFAKANGEVSNCTYGDIRLYNGTTATEGSIQICTNDNKWSAMCDHSWECTDASVACNQLGYTESDPFVFKNSHFGIWENFEFGYFQCTGDETHLVNCSTNTNPSNCKQKNQAGLRCATQVINECTHGDIQLTGSDNPLIEGKLEMCYNGIWTPVCANYMHDEETIVTCKQLGHTQYSWGSLFTEGYGNTPLVRQYAQPSCTSLATESKLVDCTKSLPITDACSKYCEIARVKCFDPGECEEGSIRLVNGTIEQEGRVEVCINGVWGSICASNYFDVTDGYVICKQLGKGIANAGPIVYTNSAYGDGEYPIVMYAIGCKGWEKSITDCTHTSYESIGKCSRNYVAGVLCHDDCKEGDIRLTQGNEGTVEVCLNSLWGMIAQSGWSTLDGQVVCRQLGYTSEGAMTFNGSYYGKTKRPVNINNVACTGTENKLLDCKYSEFSFSDKKSLTSLIEVVGVKCIGNSKNNNNNNSSQASETTPSCTPSYGALMGGVFTGIGLMVIVVIVLIVLILLVLCIFSLLKKNHVKALKDNNLKTNCNSAYGTPICTVNQTLPPVPKQNMYDETSATDGFYSSMT